MSLLTFSEKKTSFFYLILLKTKGKLPPTISQVILYFILMDFLRYA